MRFLKILRQGTMHYLASFELAANPKNSNWEGFLREFQIDFPSNQSHISMTREGSNLQRCKRKCWSYKQNLLLRVLGNVENCEGYVLFHLSHKNHSQAIKNVFTTSNIWRSTLIKKIGGGFKCFSNYEQILQEFACFGNPGKFGKKIYRQ